MSTTKVFGVSGKPTWNEISECNPKDSYGKRKYEAKDYFFSLQDDKFKVAIVRSPLVYGIGVNAICIYNQVKLVKLQCYH